jgi:hypothetical protein
MPPTPTTLLTADQARDLLKPVHRPFAKAHEHAWEQWQELREVCRAAKRESLLLPLSPTTRANFVNNHCVSRIQETVDTGNGISVTQTGGLFTAVLAFREGLAAFVRFKALDVGYTPRNVRTNVQESLSRQEWPENLFSELNVPGAVIPTVLTCGYKLTPDQVDLAGVHICCHYKRELLWHYEIGEAGAAANVIEFPPLPDLPRPQARIVSRIEPERESEDVDG